MFENYTACLELEEQRVELSLWDTSGKPPITYLSFFGCIMSVSAAAVHFDKNLAQSGNPGGAPSLDQQHPSHPPAVMQRVDTRWDGCLMLGFWPTDLISVTRYRADKEDITEMFGYTYVLSEV